MDTILDHMLVDVVEHVDKPLAAQGQILRKHVELLVLFEIDGIRDFHRELHSHAAAYLLHGRKRCNHLDPPRVPLPRTDGIQDGYLSQRLLEVVSIHDKDDIVVDGVLNLGKLPRDVIYHRQRLGVVLHPQLDHLLQQWCRRKLLIARWGTQRGDRDPHVDGLAQTAKHVRQHGPRQPCPCLAALVQHKH